MASRSRVKSASTGVQEGANHGSRYGSALLRLRSEGASGPGGRLDVTREDVVALLALGFGKAQVARALEISLSTLRRRLAERDDGAGPL